MKHTALKLISMLVLGLLGVLFAAEVSPAETLREQVIGAWTLVSHPYWPDAVGRLLYAREGQMCVTIMRPDRPKFFAASPYAETVEERVAAAAVTGYFNYCGSYHVHEEKSLVTYRVDLSLFPNWVGTQQVDFISMSGDQLTWRGAIGRSIVWERLR